MKIEQGAAPIVSSPAGAQKRAAVDSRKKPEARAEDPAYNVYLSAAAEQMTSVDQEEEARRAKVAAIRDQLASGSYNISGKDVASKILGALKG